MPLENVFVDKMPWPPKGQGLRLAQLEKYLQLFEGDRDTIRQWVKGIRKIKGQDQWYDREFVPYPAPEVAAKTLASFLFGEDAAITSAEAQDDIDALVEENHLHSLNQEAAITAAFEGEVYYKIDWDDEVSDEAIVSIMSAAMTFPRFRFGRMVEVAFVAEVAREEKNKGVGAVWRHVEIRQPELILHRLFKGTDSSLGQEVALEENSETAELGEVVDEDGRIETSIDDLLVRHVPFWRTSKSPHGISIYRGKDGLIEALHALYTQDQHDAEMAKRRVAMSGQYLKRDKAGRPVFDRSLDLFELSEEAAGMVGGEQKPIHAIEFMDTTVMGQRIAQRLDEFLLACGIAPQSAGRDVAGAAESGTARKLAQSLTVQTINTAGRYFSPSIRDVVKLCLYVKRNYLNASVPDNPTIGVALGDGFVDDPTERTKNISIARAATVMSVEQGVREQHPDWDDTEVMKEVDRIKEEEGLKVPDPFKNLPLDEDEDEQEED
jgi:hypothetical protein